jgi:hypothetical protein
MFGQELLRKGGAWLGEARAWVQRKKLNGLRVTWGTNDVLEPPVTISEVEEIAAYAAAAEINRCITEVVQCDQIPAAVKETLLKRLRRE